MSARDLLAVYLDALLCEAVCVGATSGDAHNAAMASMRVDRSPSIAGRLRADEVLAAVNVSARRLIGWRVRWERKVPGLGWMRPTCGPLTNLPAAHASADELRSNPDHYRNVRVMRVFRRSKR